MQHSVLHNVSAADIAEDVNGELTSSSSRSSLIASCPSRRLAQSIADQLGGQCLVRGRPGLELWRGSRVSLQVRCALLRALRRPLERT